MKIAGHTDFLTVDVASSSADGSLVTRQEKLTFGNKESQVTFVGAARENSIGKTDVTEIADSTKKKNCSDHNDTVSDPQPG